MVVASVYRAVVVHPAAVVSRAAALPVAARPAAAWGCRAAAHQVVLVLKGPGTIITDGRRTAVNATGNSGMARGGSGDILTGLIAALLAQGMEAFDAAHLATHLHGLAGDIAAEKFTKQAMLVTDLLDSLPEAWRTLAFPG